MNVQRVGTGFLRHGRSRGCSATGTPLPRADATPACPGWRTGPAGTASPSFEPHTYLANDDQVAAIISVEIRVKASGHTIAEDELHLWSFDDAGRVSGYQHFVDTAKHIEAAREALVV